MQPISHIEEEEGHWKDHQGLGVHQLLVGPHQLLRRLLLLLVPLARQGVALLLLLLARTVVHLLNSARAIQSGTVTIKF